MFPRWTTNRTVRCLKCRCHKKLWDGIISFPFVKDSPVYPMLKVIRKEALKHLSLAFRGFDQLLSWLPLRYFRIILLSLLSLVPQQKRLFNRSLSIDNTHHLYPILFHFSESHFLSTKMVNLVSDVLLSKNIIFSPPLA